MKVCKARCLISQDLQDTAEYVKQELAALAAEQEALDKVAAKLEKELRDAMKRKGTSAQSKKPATLVGGAFLRNELIGVPSPSPFPDPLYLSQKF